MEKPIRKRRRRKKQTLDAKAFVILAGCVVGAAALIIAACFLFGGKPSGEESGETQAVRTSMPELGVVLEAYRQDKQMVLETTYLRLTYPYSFEDYIKVRTVAGGVHTTGLEFWVQTSTMEEKMYTIWFNGQIGEQIGTFDPEDGQPAVPVTVEFSVMPDGLSADDQSTFKAAQETFNDVLPSLHENQNFQ